MRSDKVAATSVEGYISGYPTHVQSLLREIRSIILTTVPEAEEMISYQMPAYKYHGALVYFGGFKNHIGLYPTASGITHFSQQLKAYTTSKGAIQFPIDQPLPKQLIKDIVKFRKKENLEKSPAKAQRKKAR